MIIIIIIVIIIKYIQGNITNDLTTIRLSCLFPANFNYVNVFSLFFEHVKYCDAVGHKI